MRTCTRTCIHTHTHTTLHTHVSHIRHALHAVLAQADPKYQQGAAIRSPESRLRYFVSVCGSKRVDEATGAPQPAYKYENMKIICEFAKPKNEEEQPDQGERKQVRLCECGSLTVHRCA